MFFEKKTIPTLDTISDEDLISKITSLMWLATKPKTKTTALSELEQCYTETQARQKVHLWHRAKDRFQACQAPMPQRKDTKFA